MIVPSLRGAVMTPLRPDIFAVLKNQQQQTSPPSTTTQDAAPASSVGDWLATHKGTLAIGALAVIAAVILLR